MHGWGTRAIIVQVYRTATPFEQVECEIDYTDVNTVTFVFNDIPSSAQYTYVMMG